MSINNGKADAVLIDAKVFEKYIQAFNMARLLDQGEKDVANGATRSAREFFKEFKHAKKYQVKLSNTAIKDTQETWEYITGDELS